MTPWFIDTSFLLALLLADDELHPRPVAWQGQVKRQLVTTEYVLVELADALSAEPLRPLAVNTIRTLRTDSAVTVVGGSAELFEEALERYENRPDKRRGLTDCISFVVMEQYGLTEALTADHHFEQAGFRALLRHQPQ